MRACWCENGLVLLSGLSAKKRTEEVTPTSSAVGRMVGTPRRRQFYFLDKSESFGRRVLDSARIDDFVPALEDLASKTALPKIAGGPFFWGGSVLSP